MKIKIDFESQLEHAVNKEIYQADLKNKERVMEEFN